MFRLPAPPPVRPAQSGQDGQERQPAAASEPRTRTDRTVDGAASRSVPAALGMASVHTDLPRSPGHRARPRVARSAFSTRGGGAHLFSCQLTAASFVLTPAGFPPGDAVPVLQVLHGGSSSTATQSLGLAPGRLDVPSEFPQVRGVGHPAHGQLWDFWLRSRSP